MNDRFSFLDHHGKSPDERCNLLEQQVSDLNEQFTSRTHTLQASVTSLCSVVQQLNEQHAKLKQLAYYLGSMIVILGLLVFALLLEVWR